jgi:hypothetical protein
MSSSSEEFARYAKAERQLCDDAAPVLAAIIRAVEADAGLCIAEVRITVDRANRRDGSIGVNCAIIRAHLAAASDNPSQRSTVRAAKPPAAGLASNQD